MDGFLISVRQSVLGMGSHPLRYREARKTNLVVPAQAGTHNTAALETPYGFPPARE
jgi:hypothetical protein